MPRPSRLSAAAASPPVTEPSAETTPAGVDGGPDASNKPAPGRRLPRATRERQMLEVAARVFATQGFHVASMDEIATLAGISKPMLYAYFGSKKGLYMATIDQAGRHLVETVETIRRTGPAGGKMAAGISMMMRFIDRYRASWTVLFQASETDTEVAARVAGYRRALVEAAAAGLTDLADVRGTPLTPAEAEPWAHALLGAGEALARWWLDNPGETADGMGARIERMVRSLSAGPA